MAVPVIWIIGLIPHLFGADEFFLRSLYRVPGSVGLVAAAILWYSHMRVFGSGSLLRAFVVGAVLANMVVVTGLMDPPNLGGDRNAGLLVDPNNNGVLVAVALLIVIAVPTLYQRNWLRMGVGASLVVSLYTTGSRTALAAFVIGLAFLLFGPGSTPRVRRVGTLAIGAAVGVVSASIALGVGVQVFADERPDTLGQRLDILKSGFSVFLENPLLGGGVGAVPAATGGFVVHNSFLAALFEFGLVGAIWFILFALAPFQRMHGVSQSNAVLGLHVLMLVASLGIDATFQRHWYVVLALAAYGQRVVEVGGAAGRPHHQLGFR